jgi:hypothetical protein
MTTTTTADDVLAVWKRIAGEQPDLELDLRWLEADTEKGVAARPGKHGLTVDEIQIGTYGDLPEETRNYNSRPRGAARWPGAGRLGLRWGEKQQSWSESVTLLYEEAQQRQWSSARDIPWDELRSNPLPEDQELAMAQLCTFLTQVEFIAGDVPGRWISHISPDHYETALFLGTQVMDEARHLDVFRKRGLFGGVGMLEAGPGASNLLYAEDFAEMTSTLHLVGEGFVQSVFRMGELIGKNEADKRIFRLAAQDESRHVAFGVMHLKQMIAHDPSRKEEVVGHIRSQFPGAGQSRPQAGNVTIASGPRTSEALAILLGGGKANIDEGYRMLMAVQAKQQKEFAQRLKVIGLTEMADGIMQRLAQAAEVAA